MLNLHKVFYREFSPKCLHDRLDVDAEERALLNTAKSDIRKHLRTNMTALSKKQLGPENQVSPKFYTQGSCAHGTLNDPAHVPPQEIDLDDGLYLPMSLVEGAAPSLVSDQYFALVDTLLGDLATKKGWKIDTSKKTCCRVRVSKRSHIDIPLYAIPDSEFEKLHAKALQYGYQSVNEAAMRADTYSWLHISPDAVWLAVRGGKWIQSDPRVVNDWFKTQVQTHGAQFKRVCRYLKAWRDHQWQTGGPSSILLMVCASQAFQKYRGRDDLALLDVSKALVTQLAGDVYNAYVNPNGQINDLNGNDRQEAAIKAGDLYSNLEHCISRSADAEGAIRCLISQFGHRIPNQSGLVEQSSAVDVVKSAPAAVVPAPAIKRVRAG